MPETAPSPALSRIAEIANELTKGPANAHVLVRDLFEAFTEVHQHFSGTQPISNAAREAGAALLLYCPAQGGWQMGAWSGEGWLSSLAAHERLEPTHWLEPPPLPDAPQNPEMP